MDKIKTDGTTLQIKAVEENIALKEKLGKAASFEKQLVKDWKRWLGRHPE